MAKNHVVLWYYSYVTICENEAKRTVSEGSFEPFRRRFKPRLRLQQRHILLR